MRSATIRRSRTVVLIILALLVAGTANLAAQSFPRLSGRVVDDAGMISRSTEREIDELLQDLERSDSTQIVVVTVKDLDGLSIEQYALELAELWGIGTAEYDNGALLLVAEEERAIRIEVGYGLEGSLTDLIAGRIIRNIITPAFKNGDYDEGFLNATKAMVQTVNGQYAGTGNLPGEQRTGTTETNGAIVFSPFFIFLIFTVAIRMLGMGRRRGSNFWLWAMLGMSSGRHYRSGGSSGFRSSGGGFGGFSGGGGSFGGGGASGGW